MPGSNTMLLMSPVKCPKIVQPVAKDPTRLAAPRGPWNE